MRKPLLFQVDTAAYGTAAPAANAQSFGSDPASIFATQMLAVLPYPALILTLTGHVAAANQAMTDLLEMAPQNLLESAIIDLVEATSRPIAIQVFREACANSGSTQIGEIALATAAGSTLLVRYSVLRLPQTTPPCVLAILQPLGEWLSLLQDVVALTEELDLRNKQLAELNEQLHQVEQQREHMTNLLVHDIRSPLVATRASLDIVQRALPATVAPLFVGEAVDAGIQSLRTVVELTNDLLDIKKIASGHYPTVIEKVALAPLCAELKSSLHSISAEQQATLTVDVAPAYLSVRADRRLLRRVLSNLLSNALRFTPPQGTVRLSARVHSGRDVLIAVADQGPGVAAAERVRIFLPFVQGAGESKRGSGLGLAFCREVVQIHHGRIWVEACEGGGSRFCITLPQ